MLLKILNFLAQMGDQPESPTSSCTPKKKMTQRERDTLEHSLWEMAEEYREEDPLD